MNEILFKIIFVIISTIVTSFVIPYIKEKLGNEKLVKYKSWALTAVEYAEMVFNEQGTGESKKEYVLNLLNEMFNKKKIVITPEEIEILVESAVKEMKLKELNK